MAEGEDANVLSVHDPHTYDALDLKAALTEEEKAALQRLPPVSGRRSLSLADAYVFHCDRYCCVPNSAVVAVLETKEDADDLIVLDLSANYVGAVGLLPILEVADVAPQLQTLNLRAQRLTDKSVEAIVSVLEDHPRMTSLDLSKNPIGVKGARCLMDMLGSTNKVVAKIDLEGTHVPEEWQEKVANQMKGRGSA